MGGGPQQLAAVKVWEQQHGADTLLQMAVGYVSSEVLLVAVVAAVLMLLGRLPTQSSVWEAQPSCAATSHVSGAQQSECGQQVQDIAGLNACPSNCSSMCSSPAAVTSSRRQKCSCQLLTAFMAASLNSD
jgi:hypothetical protein